MMSRKKLTSFGAAALALCPMNALADGARDWINVPVDMNFLYVYYTYSNAEASIDSNLPIDGASVHASVPILRYARSFDIGGRVGAIQLIAPYGFIDAQIDGTSVESSTDGVGDIQAILVASIYGAPALSQEEFAHWKPEQYLTASLAITAPTGRYDPDKILNVGKNRWAFKPQLSWGQPYNWGALLAVNANVQLFTYNDEYHGSSVLEQDPLFSIEAHYSQNLTRALWLSADAFYSYGGETRIDDTEQDNVQNTLRLGVSGSFNFTPVDAIAVSFNSTVAKRDSTPSAQTFSINYNHAW
ncbi:transporter [Mesorhizobium xinjiangense]|uniref:transporter n=1 Tax=Mesorhizobium xinjiangense TaxID=2678685 RepID=UPI0018DCC142|nr:transporter [Mesorhizobium xinjiangense]